MLQGPGRCRVLDAELAERAELAELAGLAGLAELPSIATLLIGARNSNTFGFISHLSKVAMLRCYHDVVSLCACGCFMFSLRSCMVS